MNLKRPNYKAWLISATDYPKDGSIEGRIKFLLGYGILAPSQHNTQPWQFEVRRNTLYIKPDRSRRLPVGDREDAGLFIALGACAENIQQAATQFGLNCEVTFVDDAAELVFGEAGSRVESSEVLQAISRRHSDKNSYAEQAVDPSALDVLRTLAADSIEYQLVSDPSVLQKIVELHRQAATAVSGDERFVHELVQWLRVNGTRAYDGMPGFIAGNSSLKSIVGKVVLRRKPQIFQKMAGHDAALLASAPVVAVWTAPDKSAQTMFLYGRHIERLWLKAAELGLAAHPMHAICSEKGLSAQLATLLKTKGQPVFLLRIGHHVDSGLRTPRKSPVCN